MFVSLPLARFSCEIPSRFCDFSRRYGQENFPLGSGAEVAVAFGCGAQALISVLHRAISRHWAPFSAHCPLEVVSASHCEKSTYFSWLHGIQTQLLSAAFSQLISQSRARSAALAAFEAKPFPGADSIFSSRCAAISGQLRQPLPPRSRRPKRLGSKDRRSTRRSPPGGGAGTARDYPQIASFQTVVLHAGLETPRPLGEDRGRPKATKHTIARLWFFRK